MVLEQDFCICRWAGEWERERKKQVQRTSSRIVQLLKVKRNWFERLFYSGTKIAKREFSRSYSKKPYPPLIPIQPLNVGDKGVAKIKWKHTLTTEASEQCLKRINTYCYDLTRRNKVIGGRGWGYQNLPFSSEESKSKILRGYCGGQLTPKLLFRLRGLGLWPNNPVRGREHIRGLSDKKRWNGIMGRGQEYLWWT